MRGLLWFNKQPTRRRKKIVVSSAPHNPHVPSQCTRDAHTTIAGQKGDPIIYTSNCIHLYIRIAGYDCCLTEKVGYLTALLKRFGVNVKRYPSYTQCYIYESILQEAVGMAQTYFVKTPAELEMFAELRRRVVPKPEPSGIAEGRRWKNGRIEGSTCLTASLLGPLLARRMVLPFTELVYDDCL